MPKYYCDYCDIFLTHDSPSVRKAHNTGWKHINQVAAYYRELEPNKTQEVIDSITAAYGGQFPALRAPAPYHDGQREFRGRDSRSREFRGSSRGPDRSPYGGRYDSAPHSRGPPPPPPPPGPALSAAPQTWDN
ncbi:zf-U1-domain-containing protein [Linderina pennispora]|uniref:Zf-U1-domain-containing protein n=1 Tax=Linderina pennispora TaxID=61395 RepID=A0A1Y1WLT1_9FUNG|nr:zf-U1-domain-containing protein [Linderina pennispora]ORX74325.1 zf-U1-domain-containing protein [Linderina pennispora]